MSSRMMILKGELSASSNTCKVIPNILSNARGQGCADVQTKQGIRRDMQTRVGDRELLFFKKQLEPH
jgi:hypothetical protein